MKRKIIGVLVTMLAMVYPAIAAQVHYLQDVQFDKNAKFGVNASSANPYDATLILKNAASDNTVTIKSTEATSSYDLYLPKALGSNGQALTTDTNGQLGWSTISTVTVQDAISQTLQAIANSTQTGITASYTSPSTLNLALSSSVVLDGQDATLNVLNVASMTSVGSVTAGSVQGGSISGTSVASSGGITATTDITAGGDLKLNRDQQLIFNNDSSADSYISQDSGGDVLHFYKNGLEYMRFE